MSDIEPTAPAAIGQPIAHPLATESISTARSEGIWTRRLVLFLRVMAAIALINGLYHWAYICGFLGRTEETAFENQVISWQAATIYFAVIDLVAAVGLWLATPWGAVVWLTALVSTVVMELMFPQIFGGSIVTIVIALVFLIVYLVLAWMASRERPP